MKIFKIIDKVVIPIWSISSLGFTDESFVIELGSDREPGGVLAEGTPKIFNRVYADGNCTDQIIVLKHK